MRRGAMQKKNPDIVKKRSFAEKKAKYEANI